jgi:hypothetical protein
MCHFWVELKACKYKCFSETSVGLQFNLLSDKFSNAIYFSQLMLLGFEIVVTVAWALQRQTDLLGYVIGASNEVNTIKNAYS